MRIAIAFVILLIAMVGMIVHSIISECKLEQMKREIDMHLFSKKIKK